MIAMKPKELNEMINWLKAQINYTNEVIIESHRSNNYGRESMYEGMRDAFIRCLNKIKP